MVIAQSGGSGSEAGEAARRGARRALSTPTSPVRASVIWWPRPCDLRTHRWGCNAGAWAPGKMTEFSDPPESDDGSEREGRSDRQTSSPMEQQGKGVLLITTSVATHRLPQHVICTHRRRRWRRSSAAHHGPLAWSRGRHLAQHHRHADAGRHLRGLTSQEELTQRPSASRRRLGQPVDIARADAFRSVTMPVHQRRHPHHGWHDGAALVGSR